MLASDYYCINDLYTDVINLNSLLFKGIKFIKFILHSATRVPPLTGYF